MTNNLDKIINLKAFDEVFLNMYRKDPGFAENIYSSIKVVVMETHEVLSDRTSSKEKLKNALLTEQINMQSHLTYYLNITEDIANKGKNLWKAAVQINGIFFDRLFDSLDNYFESKKKLIFNEIDNKVTWYTGFKDVVKKGGSIINKTIEGINTVTDKVSGRKILITDVINDKTLLEELLEKYLNKETIRIDVTTILEECLEEYKKEWEKEISTQTPEVENYLVFSLPTTIYKKKEIPLQLGTAEQTLLMGIGSAVIGTVGLAAGWHTLTYALLNVFPPIALFSLFISLITGIATRDKTAIQRKNQIEEIINQYYKMLIVHLEMTHLEELKGLTIRKFIEEKSKVIINEALKRMEKVLLGNLTVEDYRMLSRAFAKHIKLIQEQLQTLEC